MCECKYSPLKENVEEMFIGPFGSALKNECFVNENEAYCMVYEQKHAIQKTMDVETRYINEQKYNELKRFNIRGGDIIVSCRGTIGETFIVPDDAPLGIMHSSIMKIRLKQGIYDKYYFNLLLKSRLKKHAIEANGSGIKMAISATELGKELFPVPSMDKQLTITNVISKISKIVELRKKEMFALDELIRARFVEIFGNIKENRFIKCKMREVAHIKHGYAYSGEYFSDKDNGVVLVTPGNFALGGGFQEIKNKYFTSKYPEEYVLHPGDLIVTMTDLSKKADTLGYGAIIPDNTSKIYLHNQRIGLFDELDKRLNPVFVRWFMQTDEYRLEIVRTSTGSTVHHTSPDRILDSLIFLPPIQLQNDFVKFANQVDKSKLYYQNHHLML